MPAIAAHEGGALSLGAVMLPVQVDAENLGAAKPRAQIDVMVAEYNRGLSPEAAGATAATTAPQPVRG